MRWSGEGDFRGGVREAEVIFAVEWGRRFSRRSAGGRAEFLGGVREAKAIFAAECGRRRQFSWRSAGGGGDFRGGKLEAETIFAAVAVKVVRLSRLTHITVLYSFYCVLIFVEIK